jgi:putative sterol carrier protein
LLNASDFCATTGLSRKQLKDLLEAKQQAYMSGRYRVEGDLGLLMKLRSLFSG